MVAHGDRNIFLIDKPTGLSSFDVIRVLRKKLYGRNPPTEPPPSINFRRTGRVKMGHAGTLDPLASGLLIVGVGEGTKKLKDLIGLTKTYEMEILLGKRTETGDMEGKILEENDKVQVTSDKVKEVLRSLEGEIELPVPVYSALKVNGVPMYKMARAGKKVEPKMRKMKIFSLKFLGLKRGDSSLFSEPVERRKRNFYIIRAELNCGSGTYARSVAEEVGRRLGYPATVYSLRRTRVGEFKIEDAERI